jgi:membrane associated rhomboid family serine protease
MSYTLVIIILTVIVSIAAFNDRSLKYNLTFSAYSVKHHKRWWLLFTHGFVHGDYMHLFFNMFVLYSFGNLVEDHFISIDKHYLFPILYVSALPAASLPSLIKYSDDPNYLAVGASGAVTCLLFYFIILDPFSKLTLMFLPFPIYSILFGVLYIIFEYVQSKRGGTMIAHDAHIAGALYSLVFIALFNIDLFVAFYHEMKGILN